MLRAGLCTWLPMRSTAALPLLFSFRDIWMYAISFAGSNRENLDDRAHTCTYDVECEHCLSTAEPVEATTSFMPGWAIMISCFAAHGVDGSAPLCYHRSCCGASCPGRDIPLCISVKRRRALLCLAPAFAKRLIYLCQLTTFLQATARCVAEVSLISLRSLPLVREHWVEAAHTAAAHWLYWGPDLSVQARGRPG